MYVNTNDAPASVTFPGSKTGLLTRKTYPSRIELEPFGVELVQSSASGTTPPSAVRPSPRPARTAAMTPVICVMMYLNTTQSGHEATSATAYH